MDNFIRMLKSYNRSIIIGALIIILAVTLFSRSGGGTIVSQIDDGVLGIGSTSGTVFIQISDMISAELVNDLDIGEPVSGGDTGAVYAGEYCNDAFGEYSIYAYEKTGAYIVIHHNNGITVFNSNSKKNTEITYTELTDAMASSA